MRDRLPPGPVSGRRDRRVISAAGNSQSGEPEKFGVTRGMGITAKRGEPREGMKPPTSPSRRRASLYTSTGNKEE